MRRDRSSAVAPGTMATTGASASARESDGLGAGRVGIPHTEVHRLRCGRAGADFELWIARPVAGVMPLPEGPRSVLYVLDANLFFGTAVEMTRIMAQLYGELPPLLVVGIAYGTDDPGLQAELRARDFTPTADSGFPEMSRSFPGAPEPTLPEDERLGGGPRFLSFLREEVRPFVERRFDVAGSTLFGSSLGGLFALWAMLEAPDSFDAFIATSPAIWWDGGMLFDREEALAAMRDDVATTLVLAVGALEEDPRIPMLSQFRMVTNVREMSARLESRGYPSLSLATLVLDGESHTSVVPVALTRGLRRIHRPTPPDGAQG